MKTIRRLLYRDILGSVAFVSLAFLSLFFFIDFVDELEGVGNRGRTVWHAVLAALLELPAHLYELLPISMLIGTIFSLSRMAQSSEFTILRTGGLGPWRALRLLGVLGVAFGIMTFLIGDYVAPASERQAALLNARFSGSLSLGAAGAWLKEKRDTPQGERAYSVNVAAATTGGSLAGIRIYAFDADGRLVSRTQARTGQVDADGTWRLSDVDVADWPSPHADDPAIKLSHLDQLLWKSTLGAGVVAAAVLPLSTMTTGDLRRYSAHLSDQAQSVQAYSTRFWRKALYPFSCLVMMALALPFAYLHARGGGISYKVFGGIMLGIAFVLLNNLSGHIGMLRGWTPWVAAAMPGLLFGLLSMAAFTWLVRYR